MDRPVVTKVTITDISTEGCGIGRTTEGRVIKVRRVFPGDLALVEYDPHPKTMPTGRIIEFIQRSPGRIEHPCRHYEEGCEGCPLGAYDYSSSLEWKRKNLQETLKRIGGVSVEVPPLIESPAGWRYRDRVELGLAILEGKLCVGYRANGKLLPIRYCLLADYGIGEVLQTFSDSVSLSLKEHSIRFRSDDEKSIGRLLLRTNGTGGIVASINLEPEFADFAGKMEALLREARLAGWIVGVSELNSRSRTLRTTGDIDVTLSSGDFSTPANLHVFNQVNPSVANLLVDSIVAECRNARKVLDLFGGWGMFGLKTAAENNSKVIVVDIDDAGLAAGASLAAKAGLNVHFVKGNLFKSESWNKLPRDFDMAIVDPPFKGLDHVGIEWLNRYGPGRLVYVSCHPAGLARDVGQMKSYRLERVLLFDMFPQTTSLETLAVLRRI